MFSDGVEHERLRLVCADGLEGAEVEEILRWTLQAHPTHHGEGAPCHLVLVELAVHPQDRGAAHVAAEEGAAEANAQRQEERGVRLAEARVTGEDGRRACRQNPGNRPLPRWRLLQRADGDGFRWAFAVHSRSRFPRGSERA